MRSAAMVREREVSNLSEPFFPHDLRRLSTGELEALCEELREFCRSTIREVGGHYASSLGAVELTVALHAAFETPRERIVWDTGHQAYIHKLVTGRSPWLSTIRQQDGLSGFLSRQESDYDSFGAGHAGTSISAAVGMALAFRARAQAGKVVAVIGDGALTAGMAFEALNHAGGAGLDNLVVVVNNNRFSIDPNVGALAGRASLKDMACSFGFDFFGPVDGHNLRELLQAFGETRVAQRPVLVEVHTVKGRGDPDAERDPVAWHAIKSGGNRSFVRAVRGAPTFSEGCAAALLRQMQADSRIVVVSAAMLQGSGLANLAREFPDRVFDVGIAEQHAVTLAAGMAAEGLRPVCAIYSTFLQRAYDQVLHDVCIQNLPVLFLVDRAGAVGEDGPTHQGVFDISTFRSIPHLTLMAPADGADLGRLMSVAFTLQGPSMLRYPRGAMPVLPDPEPHAVQCPGGKGVSGKSRVLCSGPDAVLLALGPSAWLAYDVAVGLRSQYGIEITVVDARFVKPLDEDLLAALLPRSPLTITLEDHVLAGGFGSAVLEFVARRGIDLHHPIVRLGFKDQFLPHAPQEEQRGWAGLSLQRLRDFLIKRIPSRRLYAER